MTDRLHLLPEPDEEARCRAAGELIASAFPTPAADAVGPLPAAVARVADAWVRPRRRPFAQWAAAFAAAAIVAAGLLANRAERLEYQLVGAAVERDGHFETPSGANAVVRFSDGTAIAVESRSAGRVKARTRVGATFQLERGRASFAVVHRPGADWHVEVGPFEIAVTGTEFDVHWSDDRDGFEVLMRSGTVVVRGSLTGQGIPLHAGQRLKVSLSRQTLAISDVGQATGGGGQDSTTGVTPTDSAPPAEQAQTQAQPEHAAAPPEPEERPARRDRRARDEAAAAEDADLRRAIPAPTWPPDGLLQRSPFEPPRFEPAPPPPPAAPEPEPPAQIPSAPSRQELTIRAGGDACGAAGPAPQIRFESVREGFRAGAGNPSAFSNPVLDHTHSWCGDGSLRFDATFDQSRTEEWPHVSASQVGEAIVTLPTAVDLRGKTVTMHFFVQAPFDAEFTARIYAVQVGKRVGTSYTARLTAGNWWTISNTFREPPRGFATTGSDVATVDRLILSIEASGDFRTWNGRVYVDDVSWR
jgi:hypothetical protein